MRNILFLSFLLAHFISYSQGGTEIMVFDMQVKNGEVFLQNGKNITNHKGYDNQPFFYKKKLYFSSADNNQMDIKVFDLKKNTTSIFTTTSDNEFSPTVTPDKKFVSVILQQKDKTQDLVKYSLKTKKPITLIDDLTVGYHAWINNDNVLLFVLDDTSTFSLHHYNVKTNKDMTITENIGRSLHKIPGTNTMSIVDKVSKKEWLIRQYNPVSQSITTIATTLPDRDNLAWTKNGWILMSDGKDLFYYKPGIGTSWNKVIINGDTSFLKGITRLAVNDKNNKLAVVVTE
ncbi:MAG TPA: hypothetical protein VF622_12865 [Segetibacter sp.]|jgi:hypothetical protein